MQFLKVCVFMLCIIVIVAQPYDYYKRSNLVRFTGNTFGEGVLRPGSDTGEGIFSELDAPIYSPPSDGRYNIYG